MPTIKRTAISLEEQADAEKQRADTKQSIADLDWISMMTGVDLPRNEEAENEPDRAQ